VSFIYVKNLKFDNFDCTDSQTSQDSQEEIFHFTFERFNSILGNVFKNAIYTDETEDQEYHIKLFKAYKNFEVLARGDLGLRAKVVQNGVLEASETEDGVIRKLKWEGCVKWLKRNQLEE
jgi:hypothetical protein